MFEVEGTTRDHPIEGSANYILQAQRGLFFSNEVLLEC